MAASNISLTGLMQLGDWVTGRRGEQQEAALAQSKAQTTALGAQTDYEKQATQSLAQKTQQEGESVDEANLWKDLVPSFEEGQLSPMALSHFATNDQGVPNNKWVAKHIPRTPTGKFYMPKIVRGPDGKPTGMQLMDYETGKLLPQDFHGGSDDGHAYQEPGPQGQGDQAGAGDVSLGAAGAPPPTPYTLTANHVAKMREQVFGPPKPVETGYGKDVFVEDPQNPGTFKKVAAGRDFREGQYPGYGGGNSAKSYAANLLEVLKKGDYWDNTFGRYSDASMGEREEIDKRFEDLWRGQKKGTDPTVLAKQAMREGREKYRQENPYWMLSPMDRMIQEKKDKEAGTGPGAATAPGTPGAKPVAAQEPQSLDELMGQQARGDTEKAEGVLAKHTAAVQKQLPKAKLRIAALVRGGASRAQAVEKTIEEYTKGYEDPEAGHVSAPLEDPVRAGILRKMLTEFVNAPKPGVAQQPAAPAKPKAAKGGLMMRDPEPGTGVPGTLARPVNLQIRRGGFRPRSA